MRDVEVRRATAAAMATAAALGLPADDATVLQNSNQLALRLLPCDVFARVAYVGQEVAQFEVELAQRLAATNSPVAALDPRVPPRVYAHDGFAITLWTYYAPVPPHDIAPAEYAQALAQLHAGMRQVGQPAPHFSERVAQAQQLVGDHAQTPELPDAERELLAATLEKMQQSIADRGANEQLLHGEPHPGNLLRAKDGLRFIDLETCCRGPVEFDLAHAPEEVAAHYPGVDQDLLRECRILMLAMIVAWRWDRNDQLPNGRELGAAWLGQLRAALANDGQAH